MSKKKRKYKPGKLVRTPNQIAKACAEGRWLYLYNRVTHPSWIYSMTLKTVMYMLEHKLIRFADLTQDDKREEDVKLTFDPVWGPIKRLFGATWETEKPPYMFMHSAIAANGVEVHCYKHQGTRRYLNLDDDGNLYEYTRSGYVCISDAFPTTKQNHNPKED